MKTYINEILNEFDQEFESLVIPFPEANVVAQQTVLDIFDDVNYTVDGNAKLAKIEALATEISAERYSPNYNPEICLANLLNFILSDDITPEVEDNFFQLLNEERNVDLTEALNDFDFFLDNPYKKKAEKILSKIEARKNKWTQLCVDMGKSISKVLTAVSF